MTPPPIPFHRDLHLLANPTARFKYTVNPLKKNSVVESRINLAEPWQQVAAPTPAPAPNLLFRINNGIL
jgi:hypothetical protein